MILCVTENTIQLVYLGHMGELNSCWYVYSLVCLTQLSGSINFLWLTLRVWVKKGRNKHFPVQLHNLKCSWCSLYPLCTVSTSYRRIQLHYTAVTRPYLIPFASRMWPFWWELNRLQYPATFQKVKALVSVWVLLLKYKSKANYC